MKLRKVKNHPSREDMFSKQEKIPRHLISPIDILNVKNILKEEFKEFLISLTTSKMCY